MAFSFSDFTVHLSDPTRAGLEIHGGDSQKRGELDRMLTEMMTMSELDIGRRLADVSAHLRARGCLAFNVMIMDERVLDQQERPEWLGSNNAFTLLLDPRRPDASERLEKAAAWKFRGIKFHPYSQGLDDSAFPAAVAIAKKAGKLGLWIAIDASYGTLELFRQSGVRLLAAIAAEEKEARLICLHSGGRMALEAMSIALAAPNVVMELSLSIPFWVGSSVEQDLAFMIRHVGPRRCMFSSDHPFIDLDTALAGTKDFLDRHGFSAEDQAQIFQGTGSELLVHRG